jgi:hypothetical protein
LGTEFLIHKKYKHLILDFSPDTDRICSVLIKGTHFNTTIICAHAPTEVQKDGFCENLERICMKVPKHDIKIVMGDFNAKVGKEHGLTPNVGEYSLH